jgi:tellurite resistance protein TehA-like permease
MNNYNQRYSEGDLQYPPANAPNAEETMDYSHVKYFVWFFTFLLSLSYIPGFLSVGRREWQPALMRLDYTASELPIGITLYSGWDSIYIYESSESLDLKKVDEEFDNDLSKYGELYLTLSIISYIFVFFVILCFKKYTRLRFITYFISWLALLFPIVMYIISMKQFADDLEKDTGINMKYKLSLGYGFYANFLGLLLIPVNHLLMHLK